MRIWSLKRRMKYALLLLTTIYGHFVFRAAIQVRVYYVAGRKKDAVPYYSPDDRI
jgi:hypothetical protein